MWESYWRPDTMSEVTIGPSSEASAAMGSQTRLVRLSATADCRVAFDRDATATDMLLKATDNAEVFRINPGETVNVIQESGAGKLSVVEMTF